jgi:hypothetical protein
MSLRKRLQKGATEGNWYDPAHRLGVTPFGLPLDRGSLLVNLVCKFLEQGALLI